MHHACKETFREEEFLDVVMACNMLIENMVLKMMERGRQREKQRERERELRFCDKINVCMLQIYKGSLV